MSEFDLSKIKEFYNRIPEIWAPDDAWHTYSHHELDHYIKRKQVIIRIFKSLPAFDKMFSNDGGDTNRDGWQ